MGIKEDIKILLVKEHLSIPELARKASEVSGKKYTSDGIYKKLNNRTMKYEEAQFLGNILGYKLEFVKK